jgi:hypothetical protein
MTQIVDEGTLSPDFLQAAAGVTGRSKDRKAGPRIPAGGRTPQIGSGKTQNVVETGTN